MPMGKGRGEEEVGEVEGEREREGEERKLEGRREGEKESFSGGRPFIPGAPAPASPTRQETRGD